MKAYLLKDSDNKIYTGSFGVKHYFNDHVGVVNACLFFETDTLFAVKEQLESEGIWTEIVEIYA